MGRKPQDRDRGRNNAPKNQLSEVLPSFLKGKWGALNAALIYFVLMKLYQLNHLLTPLEIVDFSPNDRNCRLIAEEIATGSEDMAFLGNGKILVTSGDLGSMLFSGDFRFDGIPCGEGKTTTAGSMFVVDMNTETFESVAVRGLPEGTYFYYYHHQF